MSRSGYSDGIEQWDLIRWRGAVASSIRGRRGQAFLREMLDAMDALPAPRLVGGDLRRPDGEVCAMGSVARARNLDVSEVEPSDREWVASIFGIAEAMVAEIAYMNDEGTPRSETPEERFTRMRAWAVSNLRGGAA